MFIVINKSKIISYIVVFSSVLVLFFTVSKIQSKSNLINSINNESNNGNEENVKSAQVSTDIIKDEPICKVNTKEKIVSLTINCENDANDIDKILEVLDKYNVKVTFFVLGEWAEKNPEDVKKISAMGHEIGNHSFEHKRLNNYKVKDIENDILKCSKLIKALTGNEAKLYSTPYGEYSDNIIKAAKNMNYTPIKWSIDSLDYEGLDSEQIWERIDNKITNGSIILLHNGTENTANSLEMIINKTKEKGYKIVPVSELLSEQE